MQKNKKKQKKERKKKHASIFSPKPTGAGEMLDNENCTLVTQNLNNHKHHQRIQGV